MSRSLGINSLINRKPQPTELHGWKLSSLCFYFGFQFPTAVLEFQWCFTHYGCSCAMRWALDFLNRFDYRPADLRLCVRISTKFNFHSQESSISLWRIQGEGGIMLASWTRAGSG